MSARTLALMNNTYQLMHEDPSIGMHAILYGFTRYESYGYPAGIKAK